MYTGCPVNDSQYSNRIQYISRQANTYKGMCSRTAKLQKFDNLNWNFFFLVKYYALQKFIFKKQNWIKLEEGNIKCF